MNGLRSWPGPQHDEGVRGSSVEKLSGTDRRGRGVLVGFVLIGVLAVIVAAFRLADEAPPRPLGIYTSRRSPLRFDPRVGRAIFVQPYGGVVLGRGVGVEPPIADLHDGSVADSAAFVHANSIGATGWCRPAERSDRGRPVPAP